MGLDSLINIYGTNLRLNYYRVKFNGVWNEFEIYIF